MDNNNSDTNNPPAPAPDLGQAPAMPPAPPDMSQSSPVPGMDQTNVTPPTPNPWDNLNQAPGQNPSNPTSDLFAPANQESSQSPQAPQSQWPSSTSTPGFSSPAEPAVPTQQANPFLQTQIPGMNIPGGEQPLPDPGAVLQAPPPPDPIQPAENPAAPITEEPLSSPVDPVQAPAASPQTPPNPFTQDPMGNAFPPSENLQDPNITQTPAPPAPEQPASTDPGNQPQATGQQGTLDLSSLQSNSGSAENPLPQQPGNGNPLPEMGPQENAPTDLSHLIAGDETHNQPGDVYAPPVAQDQNPAVGPVQTPAASDGTAPPPGKHLNLTKVLLVAGIPIILIVAALSAYLILGIGKPAQDTTNQTSLPVEKTNQQAPLTNPPRQITAPSPVSITEPLSQDTLPGASDSGTVLPGSSASPAASLSPAMQAALKKASPSPSTSPTLPN